MSASQQTDPAGQMVTVLLAGAKTTASFRASFFAAAARVGTTPSEFAILIVAHELHANGAPFDGVFRPGDFVSDGSCNPLAGDPSLTILEIGAGRVTKAELAAFETAKPDRKPWFDWATDLMRTHVLSMARAAR